VIVAVGQSFSECCDVFLPTALAGLRRGNCFLLGPCGPSPRLCRDGVRADGSWSVQRHDSPRIPGYKKYLSMAQNPKSPPSTPAHHHLILCHPLEMQVV